MLLIVDPSHTEFLQQPHLLEVQVYCVGRAVGDVFLVPIDGDDGSLDVKWLDGWSIRQVVCWVVK